MARKARLGPFFLWLHFYDAHDPYEPPEPFKTKYPGAPYDGEVAYTDSAVGKFLAYLHSKGLYDGTMISVMADHGSLWETMAKRHTVSFYTIRPCTCRWLSVASKSFRGKLVQTQAALVDVTPTILQTLGMPIPSMMQGESLLSVMKAAPGTPPRPSPTVPLFAQTLYPRKAFGFSSLYALRTGKYLFIQAPRKELYDRSNDPPGNNTIFRIPLGP